MIKGKTKFLILFIVLAGICGAAIAALKFSSTSQLDDMQKRLAAYGFHSAQIGNVDFTGSGVVFSDIQIDKDGFSTIGAIRIQASPADIILGRTANQTMIIDDMKLIGSFTDAAGLEVFGWTPRLPLLPSFSQIILNGAQLDLETAAGSLRFQAKGQGVKQADGAYNIQAALWSVQHQLKVETKWLANIYPDLTWTADIEFGDAGMNLKNAQGSRINGWMNIDAHQTATPSVSSQLDAGKITIGELNFHNFRITLNGPYTEYQLIATAEVSGYKNMETVLDLKNTATGPTVNTKIKTPKTEDLIAFLKELKQSERTSSHLAPLLLTEGNLQRITKDITNYNHDMLEMEIYGPLYDLTGKIIVIGMEDGTAKRNVISLEPVHSRDNGL